MNGQFLKVSAFGNCLFFKDKKMAKTKNINNTNLTETPKTEVKETSKKIKVVFKRNVISDYGTFTASQEAELEERVANKMINGGYAEKC